MVGHQLQRRKLLQRARSYLSAELDQQVAEGVRPRRRSPRRRSRRDRAVPGGRRSAAHGLPPFTPSASARARHVPDCAGRSRGDHVGGDGEPGPGESVVAEASLWLVCSSHVARVVALPACLLRGRAAWRCVRRHFRPGRVPLEVSETRWARLSARRWASRDCLFSRSIRAIPSGQPSRADRPGRSLGAIGNVVIALGGELLVTLAPAVAQVRSPRAHASVSACCVVPRGRVAWCAWAAARSRSASAQRESTSARMSGAHGPPMLVATGVWRAGAALGRASGTSKSALDMGGEPTATPMPRLRDPRPCGWYHGPCHLGRWRAISTGLRPAARLEPAVIRSCSRKAP